MKFTYDEKNRLVDAKSDAAGVFMPTGCTYDGDRLKSCTMKYAEETYEHDSEGRLTNVRHGRKTFRLEWGPLGVTKIIERGDADVDWIFTYEEGRLASEHDTVTRFVRTYEYDSGGRLVGSSAPKDSLERYGVSAPPESFSYDARGRMTKWSLGSDAVDYAYDDLGRLIEARGVEYTRRWKYDCR